ncbi:MAG: hypothetical protein JWN90_116 [Parcubacteria group bacterium]|nr:hypothetical protein [Parcubacteria group bacterium]
MKYLLLGTVFDLISIILGLIVFMLFASKYNGSPFVLYIVGAIIMLVILYIFRKIGKIIKK